MSDLPLGWAQELMTSPWIYVVVLTVALLDGFLPVVPSESLVITAGVFAAHGDPQLAGLIAVAATGAFVGDHTSYLIGRSSGARLDRLPVGRRRRALAWAHGALRRRGGLVLVVARYVPGGRTAVTLSMGATRYPAVRFTPFAALAAISWATYCALVGVVGGHSFEEDPLKGVLLGIGLALAIVAVVEYLRYRHRRLSRPAPSDPPASPVGRPVGIPPPHEALEADESPDPHSEAQTYQGAVRP